MAADRLRLPVLLSATTTVVAIGLVVAGFSLAGDDGALLRTAALTRETVIMTQVIGFSTVLLPH